MGTKGQARVGDAGKQGRSLGAARCERTRFGAVLVRAVTRSASADGWMDEQIDVWGIDGTHLASALQLRLVRAES